MAAGASVDAVVGAEEGGGVEENDCNGVDEVVLGCVCADGGARGTAAGGGG